MKILQLITIKKNQLFDSPRKKQKKKHWSGTFKLFQLYEKAIMSHVFVLNSIEFMSPQPLVCLLVPHLFNWCTYS